MEHRGHARVGQGLFIATLVATTVMQAYAQDVAKSIELGTVQLNLLSSSGDKIISTKGTQPNKLLSSPQITPKQTLEVLFTVTSGGEALKPQQVFLAIQHISTGAVAYAVGKASKKDASYVITAPASSVLTQIGNQGGEYSVTLLIGDVSVSNPVSWVLGELELVLDANTQTGTPGTVRTSRLQPVSNQEPVIQHMFRPAEKRPPATVSLAFSGLTLVPLLGVVFYSTVVLGINFKAWPKDGTTSIAALGFHGLTAAFLVVYLLFWTQWNLAETLPVVLALGLALALVGHKALSGLATERFTSKKD